MSTQDLSEFEALRGRAGRPSSVETFLATLPPKDVAKFKAACAAEHITPTQIADWLQMKGLTSINRTTTVKWLHEHRARHAR